MEIINSVIKSIQAKENKAVFAINTLGGMFCSWNLAAIHISDFWLKVAASIFTLLVAPPLGVFTKDFYDEKIYPILFKKRKK